MIQEPQRVALPAVLRQGLVAYREGQGPAPSYKVNDNWTGLVHQFEAWQYFVLEVLPVCNDFPKLTSVFHDRFGHFLTVQELDDLFSLVYGMKLFSAAGEQHPLVAAFRKKKGIAPGAEEPGEKPAPAPPPGGFPVHSADFTADEFKGQKKDVRRLCQLLGTEGYRPDAAAAPEDGIEWLNGLIRLPDLYEQVAARRPDLRPSRKIKRLKEETEKLRKKAFSDLKTGEQGRIKTLNRLLIEHIHPRETPKGLALEDTDADDRIALKLFNPTGLLKVLHPVFSPFKYALYLLPLVMAAALFVGANNASALAADLARVRMGLQLAPRILFGMFTVNLLATIVTAFTAYSYRATVNAFCIVFHFGFFPRFMVRTSHTEQLQRRERIWLHASGLLARAALIAVSVLVWFGTRTGDALVPQLALMTGVLAAISLFLAANPLLKSSGSSLLGALFEEPQIRSKAFIALANKFRGNVYRKADRNVLAAYALASALFVAVAVSVLLIFFGSYLKLHLGGAGVFAIALTIMLLFMRLYKKVKQVGTAYDRAVQYERWKNRALPKAEGGEAVEPEKKSSSAGYAKAVLVSLALAGLMVPYRYETGGYFTVLPNQKAELTSENAAIIRNVYFDGGESIKKGTVIAELSSTDYEGQMKVYEAKVTEQQAVVDDLKSRPKPEEVKLAERALRVQETRASFSGKKLERLEKLHREGAVSFEELEDIRREHDVDLAQVEEKRADLELIKAGVTPDVIAAAQAKLRSYEEERDYYREKVAQSAIRMPFDGKLTGVNLKQMAGHYLNKGEVFAIAENTGQVFAQVEVPESQIGYVSKSAGVRVRPLSYFDTDFPGAVSEVDSVATGNDSGKVVKVLTVLDNKDGRLKSGMTGYAKIQSDTMPVWKVFSSGLARRFQVEVWSWVP